MHHQDPSPVYTPEGIVHTAVETFAEDELEPYKITGYRSVISHSRGNNDIQASGPINQKGLKIFYYQGKYLVIVRRRDESMTGPYSIIDSSSYLGWVDNLSQITPDFVNETFANPDNRIPGFFKIGQWGNVADSMLLLADGRVAFMGHIAKFDSYRFDLSTHRQRHYSVITGILHPQSRHVSQVDISITAADVKKVHPNLIAKRPDLEDVVYPRTMGFYQKGNNPYLVGCTGVGDRYTAIYTTKWPFSVLPDMEAPQNFIFNYPGNLIDKLLNS